MNAVLVMFKSDGTRRDFPVNKPRFVVGRTNDCDLRIPLSSVSRQHCEFRLENDVLKVHDLGSSNGTYRNNTRLSQATVVAAGDEIVIGPVVFTVVIDGRPQSIDAVRTVLDRSSHTADRPAETPTVPIQPQRVAFDTGLGMSSPEPEPVEEIYTPTVNLEESDGEDDPIAALEALAAGVSDATPSDDIPDFGDDDGESESQDLLPTTEDDLDALESALPDAGPAQAAIVSSSSSSADDDDILPILEADSNDDHDTLPPILADDDDDDDGIIPLLEDDDDKASNR